ncbi:hypothetical protein BDV36DRAFT_290066 [Aspergillus pseudocaelatus]|uniref:Uncharacterized protein n=1 Tax=Aspergillus pseudocaelatus TaxID=1825620 RepID=A0ABQ6X3R7_9EURO|nr:hypothetical protein BDV36DRAFT_290066 [Aspergillus pseudocaelatus]
MSTIPESTLATLAMDLRLFNQESHNSTSFFRPWTEAQLGSYQRTQSQERSMIATIPSTPICMMEVTSLKRITRRHAVTGVNGGRAFTALIGAPEQLLREGFLTMIRTMCTDMNNDVFRKRLVVPVIMFAVKGERHLTIILAHFDGMIQSVVVHISKLYPFLAAGKYSLALFTRYAARIGEPSGNTKAVVR